MFAIGSCILGSMLFMVGSPAVDYRYEIAPGVDPQLLQVRLAGVDGLELASNGSLVIKSSFGDLLLKRPTGYQEKNGSKQAAQVKYLILDQSTYTFEVMNIDGVLPLVIETN